MQKVNMRQMKAKQSGVIAAITAQGELGRRIRDMGLVPRHGNYRPGTRTFI